MSQGIKVDKQAIIDKINQQIETHKNKIDQLQADRERITGNWREDVEGLLNKTLSDLNRLSPKAFAKKYSRYNATTPLRNGLPKLSIDEEIQEEKSLITRAKKDINKLKLISGDDIPFTFIEKQLKLGRYV